MNTSVDAGMKRSDRPDILALLHKDHYTPEEASYLLGIGIDVLYQAAQRGELRAVFAGHDVIHLRRSDLVAWLEGR